jgi:hypothetical protein
MTSPAAEDGERLAAFRRTPVYRIGSAESC